MVVVFLAVVFFVLAAFLVAVFLAAVFLAVDVSSLPSVSSVALVLEASVFFLYPRWSSGRKLLHFSLIQKGFLKPRPDFLNMVWPQTGQFSFTGTSQVIKSQVMPLVVRLCWQP